LLILIAADKLVMAAAAAVAFLRILLIAGTDGTLVLEAKSSALTTADDEGRLLIGKLDWC
jgi:hypothetical protein